MLSFMTRRSDYQRLPYARRPVNNPRRCSLVGTTNDQRFLAFDTSGANRRFVPVQLSSPESGVESLCDEMREQWFAECLALHRKGGASDVAEQRKLGTRSRTSRRDRRALVNQRGIDRHDSNLDRDASRA